MPKEKNFIDRLFVVNKPKFISSNSYLGKIKRKYKTKKAGFSGTLDPFANGTLIIGMGKYAKLFQYLKKTPKTYQATLWIGAYSDTLDIEKIDKIDVVNKLNENNIKETLKQLHGQIEYIPPKFSAKRINGQRAYNLARKQKEFDMHMITSTIYDLKLLHYKHPFITFEATVSEGTYIRSLAQIISKNLNTNGTLSSLTRIREGDFIYNNEVALTPQKYLDLEENIFLDDPKILDLGQKIFSNQFKIQKDGKYFIQQDEYFSIIQIQNNNEVKYLLNKVPNYVNTIKKD